MASGSNIIPVLHFSERLKEVSSKKLIQSLISSTHMKTALAAVGHLLPSTHLYTAVRSHGIGTVRAAEVRTVVHPLAEESGFLETGSTLQQRRINSRLLFSSPFPHKFSLELVGTDRWRPDGTLLLWLLSVSLRHGSSSNWVLTCLLLLPLLV